MAVNPAVPYWDEANTFTGHAGAAITGKRFVVVSGARVNERIRVGHAASSATVKPIGVSGFDAAIAAGVTVYNQPGLIVPVTATGAITAGAPVFSVADGRATATNPGGTGLIAGWACDDAADGADCPIKLA